MEMQCTIFELDQDRFTRDQGGIADRHREMGQLALREAGLWVKSDGRVFWDENDANDAGTGHSGERPEIDRARLRDIFLDSIQSDSIQWNKKLIRVESAEAPDTEYNLRFADGVKVGFDLVVGADGTWSRVRTLLTDQLPFYSGISVIELKAMEVSAKKWWLSNLTGQGSCFMFDEGRALVCQRNGNDSIRVYAAVRQPET
ncbi:hypothetical protein HO133_010938 [Letharia lupina]|uniref:FAD-binding domain-containing protein n=1 Tax=Letharia lupina TaxID=560253 RepID=A0A8H6FDS2_9LECA|nr:uncharacterized protein HO133_010938 [Letharia lupina]KAF6224361.1 hypothetical protein HO133_010938 [Letharia lupina]